MAPPGETAGGGAPVSNPVLSSLVRFLSISPTANLAPLALSPAPAKPPVGTPPPLNNKPNENTPVSDGAVGRFGWTGAGTPTPPKPDGATPKPAAPKPLNTSLPQRETLSPAAPAAEPFLLRSAALHEAARREFDERKAREEADAAAARRFTARPFAAPKAAPAVLKSTAPIPVEPFQLASERRAAERKAFDDASRARREAEEARRAEEAAAKDAAEAAEAEAVAAREAAFVARPMPDFTRRAGVATSGSARGRGQSASPAAGSPEAARSEAGTPAGSSSSYSSLRGGGSDGEYGSAGGAGATPGSAGGSLLFPSPSPGPSSGGRGSVMLRVAAIEAGHSPYHGSWLTPSPGGDSGGAAGAGEEGAGEEGDEDRLFDEAAGVSESLSADRERAWLERLGYASPASAGLATPGGLLLTPVPSGGAAAGAAAPSFAPTPLSAMPARTQAMLLAANRPAAATPSGTPSATHARPPPLPLPPAPSAERLWAASSPNDRVAHISSVRRSPPAAEAASAAGAADGVLATPPPRPSGAAAGFAFTPGAGALSFTPGPTPGLTAALLEALPLGHEGLAAGGASTPLPAAFGDLDDLSWADEPPSKRVSPGSEHEARTAALVMAELKGRYACLSPEAARKLSIVLEEPGAGRVELRSHPLTPDRALAPLPAVPLRRRRAGSVIREEGEEEGATEGIPNDEETVEEGGEEMLAASPVPAAAAALDEPDRG